MIPGVDPLGVLDAERSTKEKKRTEKPDFPVEILTGGGWDFAFPCCGRRTLEKREDSRKILCDLGPKH